ncbi:MAG: hypothetical protein MUP81_04300 [Dehalococcoidia bacterium]|nr:hypothetical protein [Dehalococcoidia bacterium]
MKIVIGLNQGEIVIENIAGTNEVNVLIDRNSGGQLSVDVSLQELQKALKAFE